MAKDGALIVRATAIAILVPKIFRRTVISFPFSFKVVRVTGGNLDHVQAGNSKQLFYASFSCDWLNQRLTAQDGGQRS
jgi:hypothetical protein